MIKVLGVEEYKLFLNYFRKIQQEADALNYVIDCPWTFFYADLKPTDVVLDVGCGEGGNTILAGKYAKTVYGVDEFWYPNQSKWIEKHNMKNVSFVVANAIDMPFKDEFFDVVISVSALEHSPLDKCNEIMKEIYRVTKKGSMCIMTLGTSPRQPSLSEKDIFDNYVRGTGFKLLDQNLTGWTPMSPEVIQNHKDFLRLYGCEQNWLPVGVILIK